MSIVDIFFTVEKRRTTKRKRIFNFALVALLSVALFSIGFFTLSYSFQWERLWEYRVLIGRGYVTTLLLSLCCLGLSLLLGTLFGLAERSSFLPFKYFSQLYVQIVRGSPLLIQILILYYIIANPLGIQNRFLASVVILSLFSGAYIAEIVRAGIDSIAESQLETARSLSFSKFQTYRYIIFPQMIVRILPPLTGQFASLIKDSSLLSVISVREFTFAINLFTSRTASFMEGFLLLGVGYLAVTIPIAQLSRFLEKRFGYAS